LKAVFFIFANGNGFFLAAPRALRGPLEHLLDGTIAIFTKKPRYCYDGFRGSATDSVFGILFAWHALQCHME